jgi:hypothetical protein
MTSKVKSSINWKQIETDYIYGIPIENFGNHLPTLKELAKHYKVSEGSLKIKASQDKWTKKRQIAQNEFAIEMAGKKRLMQNMNSSPGSLVLSDEMFRCTVGEVKEID